MTNLKAFCVFEAQNVNDEMVPVGKALKGKLSALMTSTCGGNHGEGWSRNTPDAEVKVRNARVTTAQTPLLSTKSGKREFIKGELWILSTPRSSRLNTCSEERL